MTHPVAPSVARIAGCYDDGLDARHYTFALQDAAAAPAVQPGQFFMLSVPGHGEAAFTYVRPPDASWRFDALVRRVGSLTSALWELPEGSAVGVRGPFGRGWPAAAFAPGSRLLAVAGGCGLAPLAPALQACAAAGGARDNVLLFGSRTRAHQVLAAERAAWSRTLHVLEVFDQVGEGACVGTPVDFLDGALAQLGAPPSHALVCGPERMMLATAAALVERGVPASAIFVSLERRMHCGVGLCGHCYIAHSYACTDGPTYRYDQWAGLLAKGAAGH